MTTTEIAMMNELYASEEYKDYLNNRWEETIALIESDSVTPSDAPDAVA